MKSYNIFASLVEDSTSGFVWSDDNNLGNGYIQIENVANRMTVFAYKRSIDRNYLKKYNESGKGRRTIKNGNNLVISEFYRERLGIQKNEIFELEITERNVFGFILSNFKHPNPFIGPSIALSVSIALISFLIAIGSLIMANCYRNSVDTTLEHISNNMAIEKNLLDQKLQDINQILGTSNYSIQGLLAGLRDVKSANNVQLKNDTARLNALSRVETMIIQMKVNTSDIEDKLRDIEILNSNFYSNANELLN